MPKYIFKKEKDETNPFDNTTVELTVESEGLEDILDGVKRFLQASGFVINGELDVIDDEVD